MHSVLHVIFYLVVSFSFYLIVFLRHIKEHLEGKVDPTVNMTQEQLQFHYFKIHDRDNDGCLDGTELIKAITHFHLGYLCFFFIK